MEIPRKFFPLLVFFLHLSGFLLSKNPQELVSVSLSSDALSLKPGDSAWLMIDVEIKPKWHIYWKTSGQSGYPTTIKWNAEQVNFGELYFPSPQYYEVMEMASYVHEGSNTLLTKITLDDQWEGNEFIEISGMFSSLICNEANCIPFKIDLGLTIPIASSTRLSPAGSELVEKAKIKWPRPTPVGTKLSLLAKERIITAEIQHPLLESLDTKNFYFFPDQDFFIHGHKQKFSFDPENSSVRFSIPKNVNSESPKLLSGVLSHPALGTGWNLEWKINSIAYGTHKKGLDSSESLTRIEPTDEGMGLAALKAFLGIVLIAFATWVFGTGETLGFPTSTRNRFRFFALLFCGLGIWLGYPFENEDGEPSIKWAEWSPELEKTLLEEGKAVYVDYTAKWCASCLGNKRVYSNESLIDLFEHKKIVALRADWTERGSVILKSLQSHGREGVPLNIYHPASNSKGTGKQPVILPEILTEKIVTDAIEKEGVYNEPGEKNFLAVLGFAVLGGLILNLMPCVFPVIGLKVMSFVKQAGQDPKLIKKHGLAFTTGVILSFWVLVAVLLFLRRTMEEDLGWGFQLQEPAFVFLLSVFLLIFAMSLSGVFEIGGSITGFGSHLTQSGGLSSSFFSGVLATVVATPCMAPFLGVAVAAALTMDWIHAYMVFTCIALGLSMPYLMLSIYPNWISQLPKPGAWMNTFKQAMAFPIYGTVAWLLWTLESLL